MRSGGKKTLKGLKSGKRYYVRVRSCKRVNQYKMQEDGEEWAEAGRDENGEPWYQSSIWGKWSRVKTVVCK